MNHGNFKFEVKDVSRRQFSGYAAAYSVDLGGDLIIPGAFRRTLEEWKNEGHVIPLLDNHSRPITVAGTKGELTSAEESPPKGLFTTFRLIEGSEGAGYARKVKGGFVRSLSIGYRARKVRPPTAAETKMGVGRVLEEVDLEEVSLVLRPMNPNAVIDPRTIKSDIGRLDEAQRADLKAYLVELDEQNKQQAPSDRQSVSDPVANAVEIARMESLRDIQLSSLLNGGRL